ncbi:MAG TPA: thiopurine S-methyltransferase [Gallionellaceae bacterium]|jgi:thiopurine S-methyltransferase
MEKDFWLERWEKAETGFHQDDINPYLKRHWPQLKLAPGSVVFVPLCGKSQDMHWLRQQPHAVLGVELSPIAVKDFFHEAGQTPLELDGGKFDCCEADGIRLLCGDFFDLGKRELSNVSAVYDRASMVALPPEMRARYVKHLASILPSGCQILLITFDYPQEQMSGPPFAVTPDEVTALYRDYADVRVLTQSDVLDENPRFKQRGMTRLVESVFLITLR